MNAKPTISAVIPCYNAAPFLRETLDSVLNQTYKPLEVILVDDGSTDDSAAIAQSYGPPVRVIRQENQGESVARNRGMDEAQGDWVGLLDADDRWVPNKLERQVAALGKAGEDVVCVYSDYILFGSVPRRARSRPMWPVESERRVRMLTDPWIQPGTALILTALTNEVRFPVGILYGEDQIFWMKLYDRGKFVHVPEPLVEYRKHAHQQTSQTGHGYRVIADLWNWVKDHSEELNPEETKLFKEQFAQKLVGWHDQAYWANNWDVVQRARALYQEMAPQSGPLPPLFERDAPTWSMRAGYRAWNTLIDILPRQLRRTLYHSSRRTVDRLKRGKVGK